MEPITSVAVAVASLIVSKGLEGFGEKVGEKVYDSSKKLTDVIRRKYPEVVERDLQRQPSYRETLIEIETVAEKDPEIAEAVIDLGEAIKSEPNQEMLLQVLNNVVNISIAEDTGRRLKSNISGNNHINTTNMIHPKETMKNQPFLKRYSSMFIGFYFSILLLILIGLLVFIPLAIAIQQVLVALIAIFGIFSLSAFKRYARYTAN